jgi:hypothetical protein
VRLLGIGLAALQLILPGAVSIADARFDAQSLAVSARGHVESQSSTECPRVHTLECALCQFLTSARSEAPAGEALVSAGEGTTHHTERDSDRASSGLASLPPSRAPPVFS